MLKALLVLSTVLGVALAIIAVDPSIDVRAARLFFVGPDHFVGNTRLGSIVRYTAWALPFLTYAAFLVAALARRIRLRQSRSGPSGRSILFLTLSLAVAPGLIVHTTLKEISHRPRPYATTDFGGKDEFRPFDRWDGACLHNCSFPSGETAAAAWMVAPASLTPPAWRAVALVGSLVFAAATGVLRMAFGGHFLSDVCAAALITILVIVALHRLLLPRDP